MAINKVIYGNETLMDITDTTATAQDVVAGKTLYTANGAKTVGSLGPATTSADGLMSSTDKAKLDQIDLTTIANKVDGVKEVYTLVQGNIYNRDTAEIGSLTTSGTLDSTKTGYYTSDYELVIPGTTYSGWQKWGGLSIVNPSVYDTNKNWIGTISPVNGNVITIPNNLDIKYVRFSIGTNQATVERQPRVVVGEETQPYSDYQNEYATTTQQIDYIDRDELTAALLTAEKPYAFLPDDLYCAVGTTMDLYNNQVCINANKFHLQWICTKGFAEGRRFTITADAVEDLPLTLNIYDDSNTRLYSKAATIHCVQPHTSGALSVLPIGDSMTYGGIQWLHEITQNLSSNSISFVGTRSVEFRSNTYQLEGYNGAAAINFLWSAQLSGVTNPFYVSSSVGFDFSYYQTNTSINPDAVIIELGTNDMNNTAYDQAAGIAQNIVAIANKIHSVQSAVPIFICSPIYRSNQDGIAHQLNSQGYSASSGRYKYNEDLKIFNLMTALYDKISELENVYLVPLGLWHDSENNFGKQTIKLNSRSQINITIPADSVHPNKTGEDGTTYGYDVVGYLQFADCIFSAISYVFAS